MTSVKKMTSFLLILLLLCSSLLLCACSGSNFSKDRASEEMNKTFDNYIETKFVVSSAFKVVDRNHDFIWEKSTDDMNSDTLFCTASITKMFTSVVILKLISEGVISFDGTLADYLPKELYEDTLVYNGTDYSSSVTIRQLLSHTSGMPDYFTEMSEKYDSIYEICYTGHDEAYQYETILDMTRNLPAHCKPGETEIAVYSDFNFQLLGKIIEQVTGKSLGENYSDYIFEPLKMTSTFLFEEGMKWGDIITIRGKETIGQYPLMQASEWAAGGIVSTCNDLVTFLEAYFDYRLFDEKYKDDVFHFNEMSTDRSYGLGLMHITKGFEMYGHNGSLGTIAIYCPSLKTFVVGTLNNCDGSGAIDLAKRLLYSIKH